jgi:hypothetical protein
MASGGVLFTLKPCWSHGILANGELHASANVNIRSVLDMQNAAWLVALSFDEA